MGYFFNYRETLTNAGLCVVSPAHPAILLFVRWGGGSVYVIYPATPASFIFARGCGHKFPCARAFVRQVGLNVLGRRGRTACSSIEIRNSRVVFVERDATCPCGGKGADAVAQPAQASKFGIRPSSS